MCGWEGWRGECREWEGDGRCGEEGGAGGVGWAERDGNGGEGGREKGLRAREKGFAERG